MHAKSRAQTDASVLKRTSSVRCCAPVKGSLWTDLNQITACLHGLFNTVGVTAVFIMIQTEMFSLEGEQLQWLICVISL